MPAKYTMTWAERGNLADLGKRSGATLAAMKTIADDWVWDLLSPAEYEAMDVEIYGGTDGLTMRLIEAESELNSAEGALGLALEALHEATVKGVGIARIRWIEAADQTEALAPLRSGGQTPAEILAEAEEWEVVWAEVEPGYEPLPGLTLATLRAQLATAHAAQRQLRLAQARRRRAAARLAVAAAALNDTAQAWYAVATVIFGPDTPNGQVLRGTIPTTYRPKYYEAAKRRRAEKRAAAQAAAPAPPGA